MQIECPHPVARILFRAFFSDFIASTRMIYSITKLPDYPIAKFLKSMSVAVLPVSSFHFRNSTA
jgi:hypothetical protein